MRSSMPAARPVLSVISFLPVMLVVIHTFNVFLPLVSLKL